MENKINISDHFSFSPQRSNRYSLPGAPQATSSVLNPGDLQSLPGVYYPRRQQQHNPAYLQEAPTLLLPPYFQDLSSRTSSLPRRSITATTTFPTTTTTTRSYYHSSHLHLFPGPDITDGRVPPPAEYLDPGERKRVSFARSLSYGDDGPRTPLLKKGESAV